jgi:hypothetical protein
MAVLASGRKRREREPALAIKPKGCSPDGAATVHQSAKAHDGECAIEIRMWSTVHRHLASQRL